MTPPTQSPLTTDGVVSGEAMRIQRRFTQPGVHPFDTVEWEIADGGGRRPFEQDGVEFPATWSQNSTNIVAQKYFRGQLDSPTRERSVKQMISRVAGTIADWGRGARLLRDARGRRRVRGRAHVHPAAPDGGLQLAGLVQRRLRGAAAVLGLLHPLGRGRHGVDPRLEHQGGQDLPRRLGLGHQPLAHPWFRGAAEQGRHRVGARLLHARRRLLGGHDQVGRQDAPRGEDGRAGRRPPRHPASSSGARPRRRTRPRRCARAGFDMSIDGDGFTSIQYQNANNSVRVTDAFMHAVENDEEWELDRPRRPATPVETDARARAACTRSPRPRGAAPIRASSTTRRSTSGTRRPNVGPHQRVQPVLGVHARRRLGLQPRVAEPDEVPPPGRHVRRRHVRARRRHRLPRPGDHRRAVELPDRGDRRQRPRVPPARPGLREPRRVPDGQRHALRLRRGSRHGGGDHGADDRPRLRASARIAGGARPLRALRGEPRAAQRGHADAPRRLLRDPGLALCERR